MTVKSFPGPFLSFSNSYLLGSESQNHGTADIGRELCSSCCSIPLFKQSQEPASTPGTYGCLPSGHMELCASFLKYYLISSSPSTLQRRVHRREQSSGCRTLARESCPLARKGGEQCSPAAQWSPAAQRLLLACEAIRQRAPPY